MPLSISLISVVEVIRKYFPTSEYCADKRRFMLTFTEKAYDAMSSDDKRVMSRHGWSYDGENDCWSVYIGD